MKYTGAQIIIRMLEMQGITTIAGIPGGANLPLYDALSQSDSITHILARHEQGAGFIAHGQARSSGKTAVCIGTSGPAATNLLTAIADAYMDSIPMITLTGQVPTALIGTKGFQEVDICSMAEAVTKKCYRVNDAADLTSIISQAFFIANSGSPGPVLIDLPKDIQLQTIEMDEWPEPVGLDYINDPYPRPFLKQMGAKAIEMIHQAQRPVMLIGGGAIHSDAAEEIQLFAEKNSIPVASTLMGLGAMNATNPLFLGMLGMHGHKSTNEILARADLLIAMGARFDDRATGKVQEFCSNASIIHIDVDPEQIGKIIRPDCAIIHDLKPVLQAIIPEVDCNERTDWLSEIAEIQNDADGFTEENRPAAMIRIIGEMTADHAIITTDVGQHQMWVAQYFPFAKSRTLLTSGGLGTMGFGLPAAIGAALQNPEQCTLCFSGDGSLLMNIQEMATLAENDLNVKIILFDNQSLGLVHQQQGLFYKQNYMASEFKQKTNFVQIAKGFGMDTFEIDPCGNWKEDICRAFDQKGPALIYIPISIDHNVFPIVSPGKGNTEMIYETIKAQPCFS